MKRAPDLRVALDVVRGAPFDILVDGRPVRAYPGESVAAALLAAGVLAAGHSARRGEPRGFFCGMGVCWECTVRIDGARMERACTTRALPGMRVQTARAGS